MQFKVCMNQANATPRSPPLKSTFYSKEIQSSSGIFEWTIENISWKKLDAERDYITEIYSDPFFTHEKGYKICLRIDPIGNDSQKNYYMSLFLCVMRGPFDDLLSWPMGLHLILELINPKTGLVHVSSTLRCDETPTYPEIDRPTVERNNGFGFPKFMELEELLSNSELTLNDQLVFRCTTKFP